MKKNLTASTAPSHHHAKHEFLAMVSHELRSPLTPILFALAQLEKKYLSKQELHKAISVIKNNVALQLRMLDDLLDFSRLQYDKVKLNFTDVDLHELLHKTINSYFIPSLEKKILIREQLHATSTELRADSIRLQQIFSNLLNNAAKFTPDGGIITIVTKYLSRQHAVSIEIKDTGIGIDAKKIKGVFNTFEQLNHDFFNGLGLGLPICKALVELHGGTIQVRSEGHNKGSSFLVTLPCRTQPTW